MEKEQILNNLGLSEKEAKTYLAILELGSSTIKPIADKAGIKRTSIYNFIDRLVELGLISQTAIRNRTHYLVLPPDRLLQLQKENLSAVENAIPEFMGLFNFSGSKPKIQYFEGVVIAINKTAKSFTVRKISEGVGVERIWPFGSPWIVSIKIVKRAAKVRRAKLYYLRNLTQKEVTRATA